MKLDVTDGKVIGKYLRDMFQGCYPGETPNSVFGTDGNAGKVALGLAIVKASENIKRGLIEGASIIHDTFKGGNIHIHIHESEKTDEAD